MRITSCNTLRPQHSKIIGFWPPVLGAHSLVSVPALECYPTHKKCPLLHLVIYECLSSCLSSPCDLLWVKPIGENIPRMLSPTQLPLPVDSIIAKVLPNFDLKNMIRAYIKYFSGKKWPKSARFQGKKIPKTPEIYDKFQQVAKNIEGRVFFKRKLSYLVCNQNWVNYFRDDRHLKKNHKIV